MPVPTRVEPEKNIWVAAGDGDLDRVREIIERYSISPNVPDPNTYTPMHAAASYGQLHVLEYLVSKGGDVNVADSDGDTPLYVVENIETAKWLLDHGAAVDRRNNEGQTPAAYLEEDSPEVSLYLENLHPTGSTSITTNPNPTSPSSPAQNNSPSSPAQNSSPSSHPGSGSLSPSQHAQNQASERLTNDLISNVHEVMQRADAEGRDPEEELRQIVGRSVLEGIATGYELASMRVEEIRGTGPREDSEEGENGSKRQRTE